MSNDETSGQESSGTERRPAHRNELAVAATEKTLKRARWEHLRMAACPGAGRVNVTNYSYGVAAARSGEHTYTVTVDRGEAVGCTCPAAEYQAGPCKHAVAVAGAPGVLDEAMGDHDGHHQSDGEHAPGARATTMADKVRADGGEPVCDECGGIERGPGGLTDVSENDWNDYDALCHECLLSVGGPGEEPDTIDADHGDERPARSEPADFGGGESNGVQEL